MHGLSRWRAPMSNGTMDRPANKAVKVQQPVAGPNNGERNADEEAVDQIGRTINVQTVFLGTIAGLLVLFTLYAASTVAVPIILACMLNLVLTPLVLGLAKLKIPEPLGAALIVFLILLII